MSVMWNERRIEVLGSRSSRKRKLSLNRRFAFAFRLTSLPLGGDAVGRRRAALLRCRKCPTRSTSRERVIVQACRTKIGLPTGLPVAASQTRTVLSQDAVTRRQAAPLGLT